MWKIKKTKQEEEDEEEEDDDDEYEYASAGVCDNDDYDETVGNVESNKEKKLRNMENTWKMKNAQTMQMTNPKKMNNTQVIHIKRVKNREYEIRRTWWRR